MADVIQYTDVMVDLETTGTMPDRTAILQIAAVKFNLKDRAVDHNFFDRCLTVPPHRSWQPDTQEWWTRRRNVLNDILVRAEPYRLVINDFWTWSAQTPSLRFWSKPSHFDYMFIQSYMRDEEMPMPFHYAQATDLRSFLSGRFYPNECPEKEVLATLEFTGEAHNALADTLHQLKLLFALMDRLEQPKKDAIDVG